MKQIHVSFCIKSMFHFVNRKAITGCEHLICSNFLYIIDILKTAGQAKKTIDSCSNILL